MVIWEVSLDEQIDSILAAPLARSIGSALPPQPDRVRERVSVLCRHDARATWEYGGYSETAYGYHVWRCTRGECKSTRILMCSRVTREDGRCMCFGEEAGA